MELQNHKELLLESLKACRARHDNALEDARAIGQVCIQVLDAWREAKKDPNGEEEHQKLLKELDVVTLKASELTEIYIEASYAFDKEEARFRDHLAANPADLPKHAVEPKETYGTGEWTPLYSSFEV